MSDVVTCAVTAPICRNCKKPIHEFYDVWEHDDTDISYCDPAMKDHRLWGDDIPPFAEPYATSIDVPLDEVEKWEALWWQSASVTTADD